MIVVDYMILGILLASILVGFVRGFFREALSLTSWILAIWVAWEFSGIAEPWLDEVFTTPSVKLWVARFLLFAVVLILGGLITSLVSTLVKKTGLTGTDRTLGMAFGLFRGILLFGLLVIFADTLKLSQESWWEESKLMPIGIGIGDWLSDMLEAGAEYVEELDEFPEPEVD